MGTIASTEAAPPPPPPPVNVVDPSFPFRVDPPSDSGAHATSAALSPDGTLLAVAYPDIQRIAVMDVENKRRVCRLIAPQQEIDPRLTFHTDVVFSPDGDKVAIGLNRRFVCVWSLSRRLPDVEFYRATYLVDTADNLNIYRIVFLSTIDVSDRLAVSYIDGSIDVIDITFNRRRFDHRMTRRCEFEITPSGDRLVAYAYNGHVLVVDTATLTPVKELHIGAMCYNVALSPDGRTLAAPTGTSSIVEIDIAAPQPEIQVAFHPQQNATRDIKYSHNGKLLYVLNGTAGAINIFSKADQRTLNTLTSGEGGVFTSIVTAPSRDRIASVTSTGRVYVIDVCNIERRVCMLVLAGRRDPRRHRLPPELWKLMLDEFM